MKGYELIRKRLTSLFGAFALCSLVVAGCKSPSDTVTTMTPPATPPTAQPGAAGQAAGGTGTGIVQPGATVPTGDL